MKWLITGGCGFIGRNLIKELLTSREDNIRIVDNLSVGNTADLSRICEFVRIDSSVFKKEQEKPTNNITSFSDQSVELIVGDIIDPDLAKAAAKDIDIIVHLAANTGVGPSVENPVLDCHTNVLGTLNYLEAARFNQVKKFVFASSGAPVGTCEPPIHEELAPHPVSPYGASKLSGEGYCSAYFHSYNVETVALRFGNVYGPLSSLKSSVVAKFIRNAMKGETLEIYGDGTQTRDFIFIEDLIQAIILAADKEGIGGEIFQIATNRETTVRELADELLAILETAGIRNVNMIYGESRIGDVKRNFSDISKAKARLGWENRVTLADGLHRTVEWFISQKI